jgi:hypothetical protein
VLADDARARRAIINDRGLNSSRKVKMKKKVAWVAAIVVTASVGPSFAAGLANEGGWAPAEKAGVLGQSLPPAEDFGPLATAEQGALLLGRLEAKWNNVMRLMKGWGDSSLQQFREGYRNYPVSVLEQALAEDTFENMQSTLNSYATQRAQKSMSKAFPMGSTRPEDAANPQVVEAHRLASKMLGEDSRDLVFIPVTPCTVWDTRFATSAPFMGVIGNGVTRQFFSHWAGGGGSYAPYGGNPSCPETAQNAIGGRPFAVMMTVYVNDAVGNGWLTFYRDGDADPSPATISVYYSTGPTRTQTVISKSSRGYGAGSYDIAVTGRFGSANAAASVTGYFIKPQATGLECIEVYGAVPVTIPAGSNICQFSTVTCTAGYTPVAPVTKWESGKPALMQIQADPATSGTYQACWLNDTAFAATASAGVRCCRVPGR